MRYRRPASPIVFLAVALGPAACTGAIDGKEPSPQSPGEQRGSSTATAGSGGPAASGSGGAAGPAPILPGMPGAPMPPPPPEGRPSEGGAAIRPLRRLTRFEFDNTIRDLLGDTSRPAQAFPEDDEGAHGFEVAAGVSSLDATVLQEAAERLAADAVRKNLAKLVSCKLPGDDVCGKAFVSSFGRRAFRRPLLALEQSALEALYTGARTQLGYDFASSIRVVLIGILQSPEFLYHWELGPQPATLAGKLIALTSWEVASRLSYLLLGTMPDEELFGAAESGALRTTEGITAQARRLLLSPRAREGVGQFFRQWWDLDRIRRTDKGANVTGWDGLRDPMRAETQRFIEAVVFEGDATIKTLLTAPYTYLGSTALAKTYYNVTLTAGATGAPLQKVELDPTQRAGFLTQGSFLAAQAAPTETSPVKRGNLVLTRILCTKLPDPPADVPPLPPSSGALKTMRDRAEDHAMNPACSGCHKLMDPLGYAFEHYDTVGRYRTTDKTVPIDASGQLSLDGASRPFKTGVELAQFLGNSPAVQACAARQVLRLALGRAEVADDEAPLAALTGVLQRGNLRELLVALVSSAAFTHRAPTAGEVLP